MRRRQDQDGMADAPHSPSVEYVSLLLQNIIICNWKTYRVRIRKSFNNCFKEANTLRILLSEF